MPLAVFLRDHDLFALADQAPEHGPAALPGGRGRGPPELARAQSWPGCGKAAFSPSTSFPEDLTAVLVNRYLEIKARHLL